MSESTPALLRRRQALVKRVAQIEPRIFRGSLIERYKRCGNPGCKCQQAQGHGPKYYLSVSQAGGRPEMDYVPEEYSQQVSTGSLMANLQHVGWNRQSHTGSRWVRKKKSSSESG